MEYVVSGHPKGKVHRTKPLLSYVSACGKDICSKGSRVIANLMAADKPMCKSCFKSAKE